MSGLQRRRILASSLLLAVLVCAALPSVSQASRKIRGPGYSTILPDHWRVQKSRNQSWYELRGYAPKTTVKLMTLAVSVISEKALAKRARVKALPSSPERLLQIVATAPQGAAQVQTRIPPRGTSLDGEPGASMVSEYILNAQADVIQTNLVARHHGRVYSIEMEVDTLLQDGGTAYLQQLVRHWHWH
ncbi:MAG: hypothetical protein JWQ18_916 [Conexibacter sp.]|nr:hypothetical protein [Conexibacter sp.]